MRCLSEQMILLGPTLLALLFVFYLWGSKPDTIAAVFPPRINKVLDQAQGPDVIVERLQDYQMANDTPLPLPEAAHLAQWISPSPAQYKANCNGVIFPDVNCARLGVVIRDSEGMVIAALSKRIPLPPSIENLEALACRKLITLAHEIGLKDEIFEGDSEVVFKHITTGLTCLASFGHIVEESQSLVSRLRRASFSHVKCCCNAVADKLAKLGKYLLDPQIWLEDIHRDATNLVIINRNYMSI